MDKDNRKVPVAILSCFLIAFILQGILKISGVFIFEKALSWEIFKIIDSNILLTITYYTIITIIGVYCLSFAFISKYNSVKWYYYVLIFVVSYGFTALRTLVLTPIYIEYILDAILYIIIPIIINLLTDKRYRLFENINITTFVMLVSLQILLYLSYLGLCYWSSMLSSFILISQTTMPASTSFLVFFEMYIGLILLMLSLNVFINYIRKEK